MPWSLRMTLYASAIVLLVLIYLGIRFFSAVRSVQLQPAGLYYSFFMAAATALLAYPILGLIQYWLKDTFSISDYPRFLIYIFWYGVIFTGVMFSWLVSIDLISLIIRKVLKTNLPEMDILFAWILLGITGIVAIYTGGKLVWHTYKIEIEEISYNFYENSEPKADPLTVVHIADLHADRYTRSHKMERYVDKVNEANPDIVIFAGDLITSGTDHIEAGARALGLIEATYGVYAVIGDHDYWSGKDIVAEALEGHGITVLRDENIWIEHDSHSIKLTGVTEIYSQSVGSNILQNLLEESRGEILRIVGSHQATDRLIEAAKTSGTDQLLAGHTHGGQIRIPVFFYMVTAARAETEFVIGSWTMENMLLNINNGLGFTLAPVRYNAPAQVSVITINW